MRERSADNRPLRMWRRLFVAFAAAVLLLPAIAMRFIEEVAWGPGDFGAAAALLAAGWLMVELIVRSSRRPAIKALAIVAVAAIVALTWAHLAVQLV